MKVFSILFFVGALNIDDGQIIFNDQDIALNDIARRKTWAFCMKTIPCTQKCT